LFRRCARRQAHPHAKISIVHWGEKYRAELLGKYDRKKSQQQCRGNGKPPEAQYLDQESAVTTSSIVKNPVKSAKWQCLLHTTLPANFSHERGKYRDKGECRHQSGKESKGKSENQLAEN